ncbi:MAG: hypothetical protein GX078_05735 [Clostridiales bacterium]|nr:hypothetical protein [Clostridiales bacterium]
MSTYIYILFLICVLFYTIYNNFLTHRKEKVVPSPFKFSENPLLFSLDILILFLMALGAYFFITDHEILILLIIYYVFVPVITIQTIVLNYRLYKKTKDKKIIFKTIMSIVLVIISWVIVFNAGKRY